MLLNAGIYVQLYKQSVIIKKTWFIVILVEHLFGLAVNGSVVSAFCTSLAALAL